MNNNILKTLVNLESSRRSRPKPKEGTIEATVTGIKNGLIEARAGDGSVYAVEPLSNGSIEIGQQIQVQNDGVSAYGTWMPT